MKSWLVHGLTGLAINHLNMQALLNQARELVSILKKAIALAEGLGGRMNFEVGCEPTIVRNSQSKGKIKS